MAGISAFGAYIPKYRLGPDTDGWDSSGERSIANFDEDSISMAVAAGIDCLRNQHRDPIDGLLFASLLHHMPRSNVHPSSPPPLTSVGTYSPLISPTFSDQVRRL
ncbi:MAG: hypothetical protein CM1200mP27_07450 [Chloroflexota bacterium]|nr:MAG: hypothetical protein CM1200mP27_07450 [Chloroflexota bacterium]